LGDLLEIGGGSKSQASRSLLQTIESKRYFVEVELAHNLNVAVQPAAGDAALASSKMDFRSNEAVRTASEISRFPRGQNPFPR
jgi:hypothetical protein